jgi:hypothetical protein
MAARIQVPPQQLLFMFLDGLPDATKIHIALNPNPPQNIAQALTFAKTYQSVTGTPKNTHDLLQKSKDENTQPSTALIRNPDIQFQSKL